MSKEIPQENYVNFFSENEGNQENEGCYCVYRQKEGDSSPIFQVSGVYSSKHEPHEGINQGPEKDEPPEC